MNGDNSDTSDKITIKVRHSDEDYHDITIDWSNESFDYKKQLFHQLSAYTGIPVEYQLRIIVENLDPLRPFGLHNDEFIDEERRILGSYDTKERSMDNIHDGDCFLFLTKLISFCDYPSIYCVYILFHPDRADENGCNLDYCHTLGSRFLTQKFSKLIKCEHKQTLLDARVEGQTGEALRKMKLNLNIEHLTRLECSANPEGAPYAILAVGRNYYLRYRG